MSYENSPYVDTSCYNIGTNSSASPALSYELAPWGKAIVGTGGYATVFKATESGTEKAVAIKKSRVSKKVKRPILRHESRILQLLQGHSAIPAVYGYGQLDHFEYLAIELPGPSIGEQQKSGAGVMVKTVIRIVDQVHIHSLGIVHRDMKPDNLLCALDDSDSTISVFHVVSLADTTHSRIAKSLLDLFTGRA